MLLFCILVAMAPQTFGAHAGKYKIKSRTELNCVDFILLQEICMTTDEEEELSRARDVVGIDERIQLRVVEIRKINQTPNEVELPRRRIKWRLIHSGVNATFVDGDTDLGDGDDGIKRITRPQITLYIHSNNKAEANNKDVVVEAEVFDENGIEVEATIQKHFTIKTPDGNLLGRHLVPPQPYETLSKQPNPKNYERLGASASVRAFPLPTCVNFGGGHIGLMETDVESPKNVVPSRGSTFENFKHTKTDDNSFFMVNAGGHIIDNIGFFRAHPEEISIPQRWTTPNCVAFSYKSIKTVHSCDWVCGWFWRERTTLPQWKIDKGTPMNNVIQHFSVENDENITSSVSKFGLTVKREALGNPEYEQTYLEPDIAP